MLRYAAWSPGRVQVAAGTGVVVALLLGVAESVHLWRALGLAAAVSVGVGAWAMDEPSARVVDAAPRSLRWRTVSRMLTVAPVATVWVVFAHHTSGQPLPLPASGRGWPLTATGVASVLVGASLATVLRRRGWAVPGQQVAVSVGLVVAALGAFPKHLWVHLAMFPIDGDADWAWALRFWVGAFGLSLVALVVATSERAWLPRRAGPCVTRGQQSRGEGVTSPRLR
jgi:hypothetical protein